MHFENKWESREKNKKYIISSLICSPSNTKAWPNELEMVLFTREYETKYSQEWDWDVKITFSDTVEFKCKWDLWVEMLKMQWIEKAQDCFQIICAF